MNTIDVTTISHVKYQTSPTSWQTFQVSIKPGNVDQTDFNHLFNARFVRIREEWIDIRLGDAQADPMFDPNPANWQGIDRHIKINDASQFDANVTGSNPDLPPVESEINYLGKWGFFFPEGEYLFDRVTVQDKLWIVGAGPRTVFKSGEIQRLLLEQLAPPTGNGYMEKPDFDAIDPLFIQPTGFFLQSVIIENITFKDAVRMQFNAHELIVRNCRFYNMLKGGIGSFKKNNHVLIENNFFGFEPGGSDPGTLEFISNNVPNFPNRGTLVRNTDKACTSMALYAEAISGMGQKNVVIQNNYFENSGDNSIAVRGLLATNTNNIETSGIVNVLISKNRIFKAGKAGIKLTYENTKNINNNGVPYGNLSCSVLDNHIREWSIFVSEAAISCDNDAIYNPQFFTYEIARVPLEGGENEGEFPNQEITQPLTPIEYFDEDGGDTGYNAVLEEAGDLVQSQRNSYSTGLVVKGNIIIGSGRATDDDTSKRETYGITARKWKNLIVTNNVVTGTPLYVQNNFADIHYLSGSTTYSGIQLRDCLDFVVESNIVENTVYVYTEANGVENDDRAGIKLIGCQRGTIHGNTIKNAGVPIRWEPNDPIRWSQGILLFKSRFCNVIGNFIGCYAPRRLEANVGYNPPQSFSSIEYAVKEAPVVVNSTAAQFSRCAENQITGNKVFNILNSPAYLINTTGDALDGLYGPINDSVII